MFVQIGLDEKFQIEVYIIEYEVHFIDVILLDEMLIIGGMLQLHELELT